jgi:hypothetical protein
VVGGVYCISYSTQLTFSYLYSLSTFLNEIRSERGLLSEKLQNLLDEKIRYKQNQLFTFPPVPSSLSAVGLSLNSMFFLSSDANIIAQQMCLLDFEPFKKIESSEFLEVRIVYCVVLCCMCVVLCTTIPLAPLTHHLTAEMES